MGFVAILFSMFVMQELHNAIQTIKQDAWNHLSKRLLWAFSEMPPLQFEKRDVNSSLQCKRCTICTDNQPPRPHLLSRQDVYTLTEFLSPVSRTSHAAETWSKAYFYASSLFSFDLCVYLHWFCIGLSSESIFLCTNVLYHPTILLLGDGCCQNEQLP